MTKPDVIADDAAKFNAPRHFGESIETAVDGDCSELLPVNKPTFRRAKARKIDALNTKDTTND